MNTLAHAKHFTTFVFAAQTRHFPCVPVTEERQVGQSDYVTLNDLLTYSESKRGPSDFSKSTLC